MVQPLEKRLVTEATLADKVQEALDTPRLKVVPYQVTGPMLSTGWPVVAGANAQGSVRYPVKFHADVKRFRVHIRNFSYADNLGYDGAINLNGMWWGRARYNIDSNVDGGYQSTPSKIQDAVVLTNGANEFITDWIETESRLGRDYLLSLGWSTPAQNAPLNLVSNWTQHWRSAVASDASAAAPSLTEGGGNGAPFDIWIECEIAEDVPVIAFVGDSITIGNMYNECFPYRYALLNNCWSVLYGHWGGSLNDWGNGSINRWTRYGAFKCDAVFVLLGINDINLDATSNDMKNRFAATLARARNNLTERVFAGTVLPSVGQTTARNNIRLGHNDWLFKYRQGLHGAVDLARLVGTDEDISIPRTGWLWDSTHPSIIGHVNIAQAIPHLVK